jgi:hypothetical protein
MIFIRRPVKLEFNLCVRFLRDGYVLGTVAGAWLRGSNQLLWLGFGERSVNRKRNFLKKKFFLRKISLSQLSAIFFDRDQFCTLSILLS